MLNIVSELLYYLVRKSSILTVLNLMVTLMVTTARASKYLHTQKLFSLIHFSSS